MTRLEDWLPLVSAVSGTPADDVAARLGDSSFVTLGGSSLGAIELLALGQRKLGSSVDSARLIGPEPTGAMSHPAAG
jgi:hypothetical protein